MNGGIFLNVSKLTPFFGNREGWTRDSPIHCSTIPSATLAAASLAALSDLWYLRAASESQRPRILIRG